jgi:hypothetical protein
MKRVGNKRANSVFEANLPTGFRKPTESDNNYGVEQYIRDKYDRKKWYNPSAIQSQPTQAAQSPLSDPKKHRTEEEEQRRRERREQRRREKQLQQQSQQSQPIQQAPIQSATNNNLFADFSSPQSSASSLINFGEFQSSGFVSPSQPQPVHAAQPQLVQTQTQPQPQPQPVQTQQNNFFANSNAEFFGSADTKAKEKEDILSLFRTPAAQAYPQNTGYQMGNQGYGFNQFQSGGFQSGGFQSNGFQSNNGGFQSNNGFQSSGFPASNGFVNSGNNFGFSSPSGNSFGFVSPNQPQVYSNAYQRQF